MREAIYAFFSKVFYKDSAYMIELPKASVRLIITYSPLISA